MGKIQKNQNGFSAVEGLLILIIVAIVGGTGWYVYSANKKTNSTYNAATQSSQSTTTFKKKSSTSTNTATGKQLVNLQSDGKTLVTLEVPKSWQTTVAHKSNDGSQHIPSCSLTISSTHTALDYGEANLIPDSSKPSDNVNVDFDVVKQEDTKALPQYFQDDIYGSYDAGIHTFSNLTINGNSAVLYNGSGKPDGSDYKQQYYLVSHNGYVACLRWRYYDAGTSGVRDYTQYQSDVDSMAKSIKFTN